MFTNKPPSCAFRRIVRRVLFSRFVLLLGGGAFRTTKPHWHDIHQELQHILLGRGRIGDARQCAARLRCRHAEHGSRRMLARRASGRRAEGRRASRILCGSGVDRLCWASGSGAIPIGGGRTTKHDTMYI